MVLEVTENAGITYAHCPCHRQGTIILDASEIPLESDKVRAQLLELIAHARDCSDASSVQAATVNRLLAERHPRLP